MFFYAQIDEYGYCVGVSQLSSEILNSNMILIDDLSIDYLRRKYDLKNKKWTDEYLKEEESDLNEYLDNEEFKRNMVLDIEYLKCLAEINGGF